MHTKSTMTNNQVEIGKDKLRDTIYKKNRIIIWWSIGFILIAWVLDSILDSVMLQENTFINQLINPTKNEIAVRLLFGFILVLFSAYAQSNINKRKRIEEELKTAIGKAEDEKNKSNAIISALGDGIIIQDTDYKILYQNQIQTDVYGSHVGEYCYKAYEGLGTVCEGCPVEITFRDGKIHRTVRQVPAENGILYIELTSSPLRDSSGKIVAGVKVVRNITEQKLAEEKRRQSELKYRTLFETISLGVVYQDASGKITSANPAAERILGLTLDQMQGRTSTDPGWKAIHEDGRDFPGETHPSMVALRTGREVMDVVMGVFNPAEEEYRWINLHAVPQFRPGENKPYQVYTTFENITERKQAEKALKESEERYRSIFDNSPIPLWEEDISDIKRYIDSLKSKSVKNFETYFEAHPEEVLKCAAMVKVLNVNMATVSLFKAKDKNDFNNGLSDIFTPHSYDVFREELIVISEGKITFESEDILKNFTGELIPVFVKWSIAPGHEATYSKRLVSIVDITERKRVEEKLRESEERYRNIVETANEGIWMLDAGGKTSYVNNKLSEMLGYGEQEMIGRFLFDFMDEAVRIEAEHLFKRRRRGINERHDFLFRRKDGKDLWTIVSTTSILDTSGQFMGTLGMITDITLRKNMEEKLMLFSYAVEEAADGIQIVDKGGHVIYSNKAVEKMYGFSREELKGKDVNEMNVDNEFAGRVILPGIIETGRWTGEIMVKHKDGRTFPVWLAASMVKDNKGMPIAMIGIIRDITVRKQAEEAIKKYTQAIEESNHMKELFTDIMHHDLLNPLSTARGFIELLNEDETEPDKKTYLQTVERNLVKSMDLIDNATKLSKLESSTNIKLENLDLKDVIEEVVKNFLPLAANAGMSIENNITSRMPLKANKIIEEVFANFISNAIKYAYSGKKIVINGEETGECWRIQVIDWGEGINDKDKERIFERFHRKEKKGIKGSGLGLAIAKKIMELHKGRIWVEDNTGGGAVFAIEIPKQRSQRPMR